MQNEGCLLVSLLLQPITIEDGHCRRALYMPIVQRVSHPPRCRCSSKPAPSRWLQAATLAQPTTHTRASSGV